MLIVLRCRRNIYPIRCCFRRPIWEPIDSIIQRPCWTWLGHVARMHIPALPKLALWGWPSTSKAGSKRRLQGSWLKAVLAKTSLSARDWFRIAVSRGGQWQAAGRSVFPSILFDLGLGRRALPFQSPHPSEYDVSMRCLQHPLAPLFVLFVGKIWVRLTHSVLTTILATQFATIGW